MKYFSRLLFLLILLLVLCEVDAQGSKNVCATPAQLMPQKAYSNPDPLNGDYCITEYVEVNYDIIQAKGSAGARTFVEGSLQQKAMAFARHDINMSFIIKYWDTPSPYTGNTTGAMLDQFRSHVTSNGGHDGDMAHLITMQSSGGLAYVDVICRENFGFAVSSIDNTYQPYPIPSWTTSVQVHESGHMLGCSHSHACVYTINGVPNQAIDGCSPFGTEGGCDDPGYPDFGSFMSYCHLVPSVGIDYDFGFHPLHVATMKNRIANATCTECIEDPDEPDTIICSDNQIIVEIQLDNYPQETSWHVLDEDGDVVGESEPYAKLQMNTYHADTLCLPDGCYSFVINDIDGIEGFGCGEGLYIVNSEDGEVASGQAFVNSEITKFCLNTEPPADDCETIPIKASEFTNYANQHRGGTIVDIESGVELDGNTWKAIEVGVTTKANSILTGEIFVETLGEIHGIGLVLNEGGLAPSQIVQLAGTQTWGVQFDRVEIGSWQPFEIPVGEMFPLYDYPYLVLVNDNDPNGPVKTKWRNIELCEDGLLGASKAMRSYPVTGSIAEETPSKGSGIKHPRGEEAEFETFDELQRAISARVERSPFPNPVTDTLTLPDTDAWFLYSSTGRMIETGFSNTVSMALLPPGIYTLWQSGNAHKIVKQ